MKTFGNMILAIVIIGVLAGALLYNQGRRNPLCEPALILGNQDNQPENIIAVLIDKLGGLPQKDAVLDTPDIRRVIVPVADWEIRSAVMQNNGDNFISTLKDDNPIMQVTIDLNVTWEDDAQGIVQWSAWRYGMVSCPLAISNGSGPKGEIKIVALTPAPPQPQETPEG